MYPICVNENDNLKCEKKRVISLNVNRRTTPAWSGLTGFGVSVPDSQAACTRGENWRKQKEQKYAMAINDDVLLSERYKSRFRSLSRSGRADETS